jgi:hypothetical protein
VIEVKEKSKQLTAVLDRRAVGERDVPEYIEIDHRAMRGRVLRAPKLRRAVPGADGAEPGGRVLLALIRRQARPAGAPVPARDRRFFVAVGRQAITAMSDAPSTAWVPSSARSSAMELRPPLAEPLRSQVSRPFDGLYQNWPSVVVIAPSCSPPPARGRDVHPGGQPAAEAQRRDLDPVGAAGEVRQRVTPLVAAKEREDIRAIAAEQRVAAGAAAQRVLPAAAREQVRAAPPDTSSSPPRARQCRPPRRA